jgi:hypothetical protein
MDIASMIPVVEGGPAGSEVPEATIRSPAERLGAGLLRDLFRKGFSSDISQNRGFECSAPILQVAPQSPLPPPGVRGARGNILSQATERDLPGIGR